MLKQTKNLGGGGEFVLAGWVRKKKLLRNPNKLCASKMVYIVLG